MDEERYYIDLAAAFVRGRLRCDPTLPPEELIELGKKAGLKLHKFKKTAGLPRVRRVLGLLQGLYPESLLDVGSGRGAFLWPLLDAFPALPVTSIDLLWQRASDIGALRRGGITRLSGFRMDVRHLAFASKSFDVITLLEVLEHIPETSEVLSEVVRVARRFVLISVPAHEDDNPEHIHLFGEEDLEKKLRAAGAAKVSFQRVLNHIIAVARV